MQVGYNRRAERDLEKLSPEVRERILEKMRFFISTPNPLKFAKRLTDDPEGDFVFKIGDWRIKFTVSKDTVVVFRIKHRSRAY